MYGLGELRLFLRAAETGNLSLAARQLDLTPAAASAGIKRLEQDLAVRLFERSTRSIRLTAEGELFREYAARALSTLADGEAQVRTGQCSLQGDIHLSAPTDLSRQVLSEWLEGFHQSYPQVRIFVHSSDGLHDLWRDGIDLAIRYGQLQDSSMVARRLCEVEQILCAAPEYLRDHGEPQVPADLAAHNCLTIFNRGRQTSNWTFYQNGHPLTVKVKGDRSSDDSSLVRQWALNGAGILYKARIDLQRDIDQGRLVTLLPDYQGNRVALNAVYTDTQYLPLRVRTLLDYLLSCFGQYTE
ncbi:LysR family transcriptional regulator [Gynuella sunshinyii]|uniref:Transcriptional regulator n=1 Tax=Gynuella sunshinyii YC6258 TaxID=1445510 RepID=A0A0C5VQR4_9GAMM|nr:LysR family transcriptional regulator [Gynuella sunshinyii]AJQ96947.1 transcriptional regulator [Gynuella sunshinyii YC6258]